MTTTTAAMITEAASLGRRGRVREAIDMYQGALKRSPDLPNAWHNLAVLQRRAGEFSQALASYQQALDRGVVVQSVALAPIFVCGMFRSGSTLIKQLPALHPRVTAGGELEMIPRAARYIPVEIGIFNVNSMVSGPTTFPDSRLHIPNQPALDSRIAVA